MADIYNHIRELTKFEIIYKDNDGKIYTPRSYIKCVEDGRLLIDPPVKNGKVCYIPDGQVVKIIISAEDGVYSGESEVLGRELSDISGLWIAYPYNTKYCQRREYLRAELNLECQINIYKDQSRTIKETKKVKMKNISGKGFSYISDEPLSDYYDIECEITLNENKIISKCEHIYIKDINSSGGKSYVNALVFIDLSEKDTESIIQQCFKYHLEARQKKLVN